MKSPQTEQLAVPPPYCSIACALVGKHSSSQLQEEEREEVREEEREEVKTL